MTMTTRLGKPRDPLKEQFWRRTIADQAQCGLPVQAYCRRKGLDPRSFRSWRQELERRGAGVASDRAGGRPSQAAELARSSAFLPVHVVREHPAPTAVSSPIEIVPATGPTVRVLPGFDTHALNAVLSVLEARRC